MTLPPELPETPQRGSLTPAPRPTPLAGARRPHRLTLCKCGHTAADHRAYTGPCYRPACGCNTHRPKE